MPEKSRLQMLEEMLAKEPNDAFLHYGIALEYRAAGDMEQAASRLRTLTEKVDPNYAAAYLQLGQILDKLNRADEARAVLTAGIAVARKIGNAHAAGEMQELLGMLD